MWNMLLPKNMVKNLIWCLNITISAHKSWKSVIIIKFGTSAIYIKFTESEHTYRLALLEDQTWDSL